MKKLLALLLSVMMAMSLTVPAFAAPAPGLSQEEAASLSVIGGQDGPTAIITVPIADWDNSSETVEHLLQQQIDSIKESLGGVPGQIGVMVNGEYVQFPDAVPEIKDGCAMVPIRALAEVLGGQVAYGDEEIGQLVKEADKPLLTFTVDSRQVAVEYPSGDGELRTLSCAPYIKDGRAYVPVRFMGEVLGYEVGWDSQFQTAILLDREAMAAEIDKDFTILNRVQASRALSLEDGKSYSADMEGALTVTAFDTLNGDKTYTADLSGEALLNSEAASGSYSLALSGNAVDALMELLTSASTYADDEDVALLRTVLENLSMDVVMTNEGMVFVHAPAADELNGEKNLWYEYNMGAELAQAIFTGTGATTVGSALTAMMSTDSVISCATMAQSVKSMAAIYGDDNFTTSKGVSTCTIGADDLAALYGDMGLGSGELESIKNLWKEYSITMQVDSKGGVTASCRMETEAQSGVPAMKMTIDAAQSGGKADVTMKIHVANLGEMTLELTAAQETTSEKPMTTPPDDGIIIDTPALLNP